MNQLLEKFSYVETINNAGKIKTLSSFINRKTLQMKHEKIVKSETIIWSKRYQKEDINSQLIKSIRQVYPKGNLYIGKHHLTELELEDELRLLKEAQSVISQTNNKDSLGLILKSRDKDIYIYRIYKQTDNQSAIKTKMFGEQVWLVRRGESLRADTEPRLMC